MLTTKRLRPDPLSDQHIVADVRRGSAPALVFLHGMSSSRVGSKSEALLARAHSAGLKWMRGIGTARSLARTGSVT